MYKCLNREELEILIRFNNEGKIPESEEMFDLLSMSRSYHYEIGALSYSFGILLLKWKKNLEYELAQVSMFYDLPAKMYFEIEEIDFELIEYLISILPESSNSIEENLIEYKTDIKNHRYARKIRY